MHIGTTPELIIIILLLSLLVIVTEMVHKEKSQRHCIIRYKMALSNALSVNKGDSEESMKIANSVINEARLTSGQEHTKMAYYTRILARLYRNSEDNDIAKRLSLNPRNICRNTRTLTFRILWRLGSFIQEID